MLTRLPLLAYVAPPHNAYTRMLTALVATRMHYAGEHANEAQSCFMKDEHATIIGGPKARFIGNSGTNGSSLKVNMI